MSVGSGCRCRSSCWRGSRVPTQAGKPMAVWIVGWFLRAQKRTRPAPLHVLAVVARQSYLLSPYTLLRTLPSRSLLIRGLRSPRKPQKRPLFRLLLTRLHSRKHLYSHLPRHQLPPCHTHILTLHLSQSSQPEVTLCLEVVQKTGPRQRLIQRTLRILSCDL
eukprot:Rmarinus@m.13460